MCYLHIISIDNTTIYSNFQNKYLNTEIIKKKIQTQSYIRNIENEIYYR